MASSGGDLFIVDNSISGWTGLKYLKEWTEISTGFDIATGYFEIGALLALDGHWQKLDKIRILMGDETTRKTKRLLLEALKEKAEDAIESNLKPLKMITRFLMASLPSLSQLRAVRLNAEFITNRSSTLKHI